MEAMIRPSETNSIMYQDFTAKRPMEVETYLGSSVKFAQEVSVAVPRIETLYAMLHHLNIVNQTRQTAPTPMSPGVGPPPPRLQSAISHRPPMGVAMGGRGSRAPSMTGPPPPVIRKGPPPTNGFPPRMTNGNGYPPNGGPPVNRRPSFEGNDLQEFSHLMLYDNAPEGGFTEGSSGVYGEGNTTSSSSDLALRERELMLRQKELALREQEYNLRRAQPRRPMPPPSHAGGFDDDDDDEDLFDSMTARGPAAPIIDPDNFDMMSVTSRRNRKAPSAREFRKNPEAQTQQGRSRNPFSRGGMKTRTSAGLMADVPGLHDSLMNNPMLGYSSNRYGVVDRAAIGHESRTNSLTAERLNELSRGGGGAYPAYPTLERRTSQSPGNPLSPRPRNGGRPSPPNGYPAVNGAPHSGRPSPPGMRQPVARHPPGYGSAPAPQQVEQHAGVSNLYPPKNGPQVRSLTGSASASAGSGDSGASAQLDSENSAYSSQSSLGPRPPIGVR